MFDFGTYEWQVEQLKMALGDAKAEYARLLTELQDLEIVKREN